MPKSNVLPYFSKESMLDVLDGLEYFYNLLKEYEYKENKALMKYSLKILWKNKQVREKAIGVSKKTGKKNKEEEEQLQVIQEYPRLRQKKKES